MQDHEDEVLLKVEHLCQYFKSGNNELKAVDGVSFDIYKSEVFGLVGESGCGKTTTGRSIIKLYKITSGNVWFKGTRIAAGTRRLEEKLQALRREGRKKIAGFIKNKDTDAAKKEKEKLEADVQKLRDEIKIPAMAVMQFAFGSDASNPYFPHNVKRECVYYTGTHDNDTACGWYASATEAAKDQLRRYFRSSGDVPNWDMIHAVLLGVPRLAVIPMQDIAPYLKSIAELGGRFSLKKETTIGKLEK